MKRQTAEGRIELKKGFTLIELLVVVSIIGLLSSVVLAALSGARNKGSIAAVQEFSMANYHGLGDRLLWWYGFNDSSAGSTADLGGNSAMTGTLVGSPARTSVSYTGSAGSALVLTGTPQKVTVPNVTLPVGSNGMTLSAWVLISDTGYDPAIIEFGSQFEFAIGPDVSCRASMYDNWSSNTLDGATNLCDSKWHNVTVTVGNKASTGSTTQKIYIDGRVDGTFTVSSPCTCSLSINVSSPITLTNAIGWDNGGGWVGTSAYGKFTIDDVMEFSGAMPLSEAQKLYAMGAAEHGIALK